MQEGGLLLADSVLGAYTAVYLANVVHHERLDHGLGTLLKAFIVVAIEHHVQMQVPVADVTVAVGQNSLFFVRSEGVTLLNQLSRRLHNLVVVTRRQTNVVLQRL